MGQKDAEVAWVNGGWESGGSDRHGGFRVFFDSLVLDHDSAFRQPLVPSVEVLARLFVGI